MYYILRAINSKNSTETLEQKCANVEPEGPIQRQIIKPQPTPDPA